LQLAPRKSNGGFVYVFRMTYQNTLELIHKTDLEEAPTAFCAFQGRLLIGMGKLLRIYDLGKRKLLRKCEQLFPNLVIGIDTQGDRVVVSDVQESTHFARYVLQENRFHVFCDDHKPRWITRAMMLDFHTVAAADKFGNFFINRLPSDLVNEDETEMAKSKSLSDKSFLNGAAFRLDTVSHYYVGDVITSLCKTPMVAGGRDVIVYTTLCGEIGIFAALPSRDDADFFQALETQMRAEAVPLCGRDHLAFRSSFMPVRVCFIEISSTHIQLSFCSVSLTGSL
jgi:splicing factor 3B subunit 3